MKWIKASEGLPDMNIAHVICRYAPKGCGLTWEVKQSNAAYVKWLSQQGAYTVEWLDESPLPSPNSTEQAGEKDDYWKKRCELAECFVDPDPLYLSFKNKKIFDEWQQLKQEGK